MRQIVLDGTRAGAADISEIALTSIPVSLDAAGIDRAAASHRAVKEIMSGRQVYGRNTGVGANRDEGVTSTDGDTHGLRLMRSHAGGIGPLLPAPQVRAMLAVRANQILAGGGGLQPVFAERLAQALNSGHLPEVHEIGGIGTGDMTALAETGLTLIGERPWTGGRGSAPTPITLEAGEALAFFSSGALTIGQAALGWSEITTLLRATQAVAALSLLAIEGDTEPYDVQVHAARPHPGPVAVAAEMRRLLGTPAHARARIQDPYGFRCFPQVHGPAVEVAATLERVLNIEINAAAENPLISASDLTVHHHGSFHQAALGLTLDHLRVALLHTAHLSAARLAILAEPGFTGLRPFLAEGPAGSSGVMILEYSANAALAQLRSSAYPAALGHAVLSRGMEEHASFAAQAARQTLAAAGDYRLVVACELVAAARALRQRGHALDPSAPTGKAFAEAAAHLDPDGADRSLSTDVEVAASVLDQLAAV
ncbi:aromatic amino acid lyase [Streptosporangiaceae bacterium NEAU-GS5]|nr:aromatic amino acid lyase [Streptosporangiaceae bacterium NEAU-GS5]